MACKLASLFNSKNCHAFPKSSTSKIGLPSSYFNNSIKNQKRIYLSTSTTNSSNGSSSFTWDDVVRVSQPHYDASDLTGFFQKIKICNRGSEMQYMFIPFVVEDQIVGYLHHDFASHLRRYQDVFIFAEENPYGDCVKLHPMLKTPEDRTAEVGQVITCLGKEELIPGIRNELYPVTSSFGSPVLFSLERAAAPYFGIKV
ncbi:hypothetical protein CFOL_v3_35590, partial [Cephalotus follicularis]